MNPEALRTIEANLIVHAWKNPEFEQRLRREPRAAVEEIAGMPLPDELEIVLVTQVKGVKKWTGQGVWQICLPQHPSQTPELRPLDFEDFTPLHACGSDWSCPTTGCCRPGTRCVPGLIQNTTMSV